ncbi:MAG: sugar phosphate isomerase/epimerase [Planctomycetaceae bacterium]|nr:sugar phosphate isomerase/epimerase [Planctomycetaceae bacterium]
MKNRSSRRDFLKHSSLAAAASFALTGSSAQAADQPTPDKPAFKLGLASYTTRNFTLDQTIEIAKRAGLTHLSLKDMHLPLTASDEEIKAGIAKICDAGIIPYAVGVIYMKTAEDVNRAFNYAKTAGVRLIVGVPNHELLPLVNQRAIEYDIEVAIHNHGPTDKVYPTPESAYEKIKNLDKRLGLCIDAGHTQRSGINPAHDVERFADRLLDVHLKDVSASTKEGTTVEMGRGVIDIPALLSALLKINYSRIASFEYEKDARDPLPGTAESVGYTRGVLATLQRT